jgi:methionyl-tRNA synthetase
MKRICTAAPKKIYITTPIYYVNAKPHIGHAYTTIVCDIFARYQRMIGNDVKFTTGTDEHGKKIEQSANGQGLDPRTFTDQVSQYFRDLLVSINATNDDFIRTTEERHKKSVRHFWNVLYDKGYIYLGEYSGWYDIRNEAYFSESELIDGKSPFGGDVQYITEPCYFFKLSEFGDRLLKFYEDNPNFIYPNSRRNEVISFVQGGLKDLAISRGSFKWGIPVPNDEDHVVYVWLDALTNYLTLIGYPDEFDQGYWDNSIHFVGKEIIRFHAVYWPAFLMAAGMTTPKQVVSHGWWLSENEKMSKSLGNVQDPVKYCDLFGSDALRYFVIRELQFGSDGNFSLSGFVNRYNSFLANSYGNLCHRVSSFISENCQDKTVTRPVNIEAEDLEFIERVTSCLNESTDLIEQYAFGRYIEKIEAAVVAANQYIDKQKPWALRRDESMDRMNDVLFISLEQIYRITKYLYPVIPDSSAKFLAQIGVSDDESICIEDELPDSVTVDNPSALFQKIDASDIGRFDVYEK